MRNTLRASYFFFLSFLWEKIAKGLGIMFLAFFYSTIVYSQTPAELLQTRLNALRTMTAHFSQVVKAKKREVSRASGTMALQRPGLFRWHTLKPMEQLIVADGKKMWIYDVDLEQVTVKKQQKGLGGTAALFLSGYDHNMTDDFKVTEDTKGALTTYHLKAKSGKENFQQINLLFTKEKLVGIELFDQLGQTTVVKLNNITLNPSLSAKLFQFKPPKGADIVQQ